MSGTYLWTVDCFLATHRPDSACCENPPSSVHFFPQLYRDYQCFLSDLEYFVGILVDCETYHSIG